MRPLMKSLMKDYFYGTVSDVIAGRPEGAVQQGTVRARVLTAFQLKKEDIKLTFVQSNILLQGGQNRGGIINPGPAKPIKCYNCNGLGHIARECPRPKRLQDSDYFKDKMLLMQAQENGAVLDEEQSLSKDRIYDEARTSYDSNTPFEVQDHDTFVNHLDEYHEVHEMQTDEQHNYVVDSDADYMSNSNIISYDQYVEDNEDHVIQRNVSFVRNDALMSILNELHERGVQSRLANKPDMIINDSVTSELARYKELVGEYEKRAKFELTDKERKIDEQMRIIISDRNRKETSLKSELHSAQILMIFWSIDDNNRKKAETSVPKPISALTVYPPNTPVKFPKILTTKSQVKINLYGERGFEQTKRCYLTEVIPFFKTLKEHFVGVQTALFKEVKVMEEIFDQMNNEVDKNTVDIATGAKIVKKNLLIENENLIANCLSTQLLYDVQKSRCLDLEADMSKVHNESKHISKLEREYLNLQLKYQHLQESFDNKNSHTVQEAPDFNSFFKESKNLNIRFKKKDTSNASTDRKQSKLRKQYKEK
ncbi:integrase, catalytic region, zinc finger, CCHC-type containing protein [Tanacetum coccineum]